MKEEGEIEQTSDGELISRVKAGDMGGFDELVRRYQKKIYYLALKMVRDHDLADEVVQDAFVKAYHAMNKFKEGYPFYPWIYRIAVNICMNHLKQSKRQIRLSDEREIREPVGRENPHSNPEKSLMEVEKMKRLENAIDALPPKWKAVLVLRAHEDLSYEEISKVLRIPKGTVMSRLNRARERLKEVLEKL
ncbi:sigma-70 family RNA polymerase sigma factor [candidate division TA06 bacterium]|nr:sigma-70 family RNA polymerase sigma factor [candidate division TA06 bacterium]